MRRSKFLKPILVILAAALVVVFSYILFWYGTLRLENVHDGTSVFIGERQLTPDEVADGVKLRPGKYEVLITGPVITAQTSMVSVGPFGTTRLGNETTTLDLAGTLEYVAGRHLPSDDYRIAGGQLFENNTWLVVRVGSTAGQFEGYIDIYRFSGRGWEVFDSGTGFDTDGYTESGYPESVMRYLNGER